MTVSTFSVSEASSGEYYGIAATACEWRELAEARQTRAISKGYDDEPFYDSKTISNGVVNMLGFSDYPHHVVVYRDDCKKIQAIGLFRESAFGRITIDSLVTHPDNIRHPLNKDAFGRVVGAASAIMHYVQEKGVPIELESLPGSQTFYERFGFETVAVLPYGCCNMVYIPKLFEKSA